MLRRRLGEGGRAGVGVYYADGDARNRSLALPPRVGATPGANNIAEICAIFDAVFRAARDTARCVLGLGARPPDA